MHRGPLSKLKQEYEEKQKLADNKPAQVVKTFVPKITAAIPKHNFNPIIKDNKVTEETKTNEDDDEKHKLKENSKNAENLKFISEEVNNGVVLPPKPLPRASRTNSVCETTTTAMDEVNSAPKPVARPRTNSCAPVVVTSVNPSMPVAGGYKVFLLFWGSRCCFCFLLRSLE